MGEWEAKNEGGGGGGGGLVLYWGYGEFLKSLYIVGSGVLAPYFMKTLLYCQLRFFKFCPFPPSPRTSLSPPTLTLTVLSVVPFLWLNGWSLHIWCAILLNDNMDLHMSGLGTLVPEGPWCVFYATRHQVYWGLTHNVIFYWYSHLISHKHTHTHTHTHTQIHTIRLTHPLYLHHLLCAQSSYLKWLN